MKLFPGQKPNRPWPWWAELLYGAVALVALGFVAWVAVNLVAHLIK